MLALSVCLFAPVLLLAQTATPQPISLEWRQGLISLLLIILVVTQVWNKLKRKPPLEDTFSTKKDREDGDVRAELQCAKDSSKHFFVDS